SNPSPGRGPSCDDGVPARHALLVPFLSPPQAYGSMRFRRPASSARTWFVCRRLRFRLVAFLVRMWLRLAWPALNLPDAVLRNRLAAPRWVLILGIADVLSVSVTGLGGGWATLSVLPGPVMRRAPPPGRERATCPYVCLVPESATPAEPGPPSMAARAWACNGGGAGLLLLGRDHHHHLPPLEARPGFDDDVLPEILLDPLGHLATQLLVAHLAATEADVDLDLVALFEELAHLAHLDRVVAGVGDGAELHFLDFDLLLLLLGRVGLLLQVEHVLAEVHDPADRRVAVRLDLDQVKARLLGGRERLVAREHAKHLAFTVDHAYPRDADLLVPSVSLVGGADVAISVGVGPAGGPCSHCAACFSARPR